MKRNHLSLAIGLVLATATCGAYASDAIDAWRRVRERHGDRRHRADAKAADTASAADTAAADAAEDAQDAPAAAPAAAAKAKDPSNLGKITVTARRREETLEDVPVAVTAFTPEALEKLNVRDIGDLDAQVPNLTIYAARGSNTTLTAYIRGVGQSDPLWGVDPGVGLYLDDVYIARPQGALLDVFDVGRIEVLRGPQGTLYGKNTVGGAIKYISRDMPTEFEGYAEVTAGSYGQADFKGALAGSLGGAVRMRLAAASLTRGGFGENLVTGVDVSDKDTKALRFTLGVFPDGDVFDGRLTLDYMSDTSGVRGAQMLATNRFDPSVPDSAPLADRYDVRSGFYPDNSTTSGGAAWTMNWRPTDAWSFKSISAWRKSDTETSIDFDTLPAALADVHAGYHDKQLSQEFQGAYDEGGKLTGVLGIYWFKGEAGGLVKNIFLRGADFPPFFPNPPGPGFGGQYGTTDGIVYTKSIAGYADFDYAFTDKLSVGGGLRWTQEEKNGVVNNQSFANINFNPPTLTVGFDKSITFTNLSPKFSVDYQVTDDMLVYGSWSRGFKSGGYNIRASVLPNSQLPYDDEQVDSLEFGSKMGFLGGPRLRQRRAVPQQVQGHPAVGVHLLRRRRRDHLLRRLHQRRPGHGRRRRVRVAGATDRTLGLHRQPRLARREVRRVHVQGREHRRPAGIHQRAGLLGCVQRRVPHAGRRRGRIQHPRHLQLPERRDRDHEVTVDPVTKAVVVPIHQDGYGLFSAGAIWKTGGAWSFSVQGTNLADKKFLTTGYVIPSLGVRTGFYGNPRQWMVSARYEFLTFAITLIDSGGPLVRPLFLFPEWERKPAVPGRDTPQVRPCRLISDIHVADCPAGTAGFRSPR
jgi:iron complex outermembrane receptor protein